MVGPAGASSSSRRDTDRKSYVEFYGAGRVHPRPTKKDTKAAKTIGPVELLLDVGRFYADIKHHFAYRGLGFHKEIIPDASSDFSSY